jgi:hypothetical protein
VANIMGPSMVIAIFQIDIIIFTLTMRVLLPINTYITGVMANEI